MRKVLAILLLISVLLLESCSDAHNTEDILSEFCRQYPIDMTVYSSSKKTSEEGYIDADMLNGLYGISEYPVSDFSLVLYGKVDTVREIGVFATKTGEEKIETLELLKNRIDFLSSFSYGEGFIKKYKDILIYGFVENASYAEELFDNIL